MREICEMIFRCPANWMTVRKRESADLRVILGVRIITWLGLRKIGEMMMKKYLLILTFGVLASFMVTGCLGILEQQADRGEQGMAEAKFKTYSQLTGAENGVIIIKVKNKLSTTVLLRITMVKEEDAWKLFEIPGEETLQIEVGATDYLLQAQIDESDGNAEYGSSNELLISASDAIVEITGVSNQFEIFIPKEE